MFYFLCSVFFFFKQKTAYEMRISDWSSDVCSSDLLPLALSVASRPASAAHQVAIQVVEVGTHLDYCLAQRLRHPGSPSSCWSAARSGRAVAVQIGRASCRERVCQYV